MARRVKLIIAYLGAPFRGWQRQLNGPTVQGELERAFSTVTGGIEIAVVGAGRTDAGVHAAGQAAHCDLPVPIPLGALQNALNAALPDEIRVRRIVAAGAAFHARKNALGKLYTYRARWSRSLPPWLGLRTAHLRPVVRWRELEETLAVLRGRHDMASFTVADGDRDDTTRTLFRCWMQRRPQGVDLHFVGDGFLRYQVRRMVGALLLVGWGKLTADDVERLLRHPHAGAPLLTAPARGLTLERVLYRHARLLAAAETGPGDAL